jgi:hypothetical protein
MEAASFVVVLLAVPYNFFLPVPGKMVATLCVLTLLVLSLLVPTTYVESHQEVLFALFIVYHICLFLLSNIATAWSVSTTLPVSRYRALGTAFIQILHLLVLFVPHMFAETSTLVVIAVASCAICLWGVLKYNTLELYKEGTHVEEKFTHGVSGASAIAFILACVIGLNGEQILDASLKLNLKNAHWEGDRNPIALNHLITAGSRFLAFGMSSDFVEPSKLMSVWLIAQILRLGLMGAHADLSSLWITGGLILLDKWSGTLGEIALETALLKKLSHSPSGFFPAIFLMSLYQPLEDITGSAVQVLVRGGRSAASESPLGLFHDYKGVIVSAMVISIYFVVTKWSHYDEPAKEKQKKD